MADICKTFMAEAEKLRSKGAAMTDREAFQRWHAAQTTDHPNWAWAAWQAAVAAERERWIAKAGATYTEAHTIFNDPPSETSQDVRDVIEWHLWALRADICTEPPAIPTGDVSESTFGEWQEASK